MAYYVTTTMREGAAVTKIAFPQSARNSEHSHPKEVAQQKRSAPTMSL